ncbi:spermatid-specific linker histone H1-like protein [Malaclemys terrapin pileata]|uniref:spermatid-specific linker histone H1-like protein n=1 Tax=Malaclemys terrapin pileata TaxID=2991368 RepID=UPI0023A8AF02|nr:spermatid-specific linker histone H1-like protein [Malaclemys terrapin pileata]
MDDAKNPSEVLPLDSATPASGNPDPEAPGSADGGSANPTAETRENPEQPEASGSSLPKKTKPSGSRISKPSTSPGASLAKLSKPLSQGLSKLILEAVATSKKRTGLSLQALKKIIVATGYNMAKKKTHFKRVLMSLVTKGLLQKLKGTGASGSFGIGKEMAKKMGPGHKKKKASKKRGRPLKVGIAATSLAERGQLLTMDLLRKPSHQPATLGSNQPTPEG